MRSTCFLSFLCASLATIADCERVAAEFHRSDQSFLIFFCNNLFFQFPDLDDLGEYADLRFTLFPSHDSALLPVRLTQLPPPLNNSTKVDPDHG